MDHLFSFFSGKRGERTRAGYEGKLKQFEKWCRQDDVAERWPDAAKIEDGKAVLQVPINDELLNAFMQDQKTLKDAAGAASGPASFSNVGGFRSAFIFYHKDRKIDIPESTQSILSDFCSGKLTGFV